MVGLIGLSYAEISFMYNRTGVPLVCAQEALGKTAGFTVGWMVWITRSVRQPVPKPAKPRTRIPENSVASSKVPGNSAA